MRSVKIKLFKRKISQYARPAAKPCSSRTATAWSPNSVRPRRGGPLVSDALLLVPSARGDQATAIGWKANAGPKAGDETP